MCIGYFGFVPIFLREDFHTCYTDAPLACLFGVCIYAALVIRPRHVGDVLSLAVMTAYLFPVRNAGFGYAVMLMVLFAFRIFSECRKNGRMNLGQIFAILLFFALPFLVKFSWTELLNFYQTPRKFGGNAISLSGIVRAFLYNDPPRTWQITGDFLLRLSCGYIEVFLLTIYAFNVLRKRTVSEVRARQSYASLWFFPVIFTLFLLTMLIYYIFEFHEHKTLPSFDRYVSAFLMIPVFVLLFLWNDEITERGRNNGIVESGFGVNSVRRKKILWVVSVWCVIATLYNFFPFTAAIWWKHRLECDRMQKDYGQILSGNGILFGLITSTGKGFKNFYGAYLYPEQFRELKSWDPVLELKKDDPAWEYATKTTLPELKEELAQRDYVYIESVRPEFIRDFAAVFAPGTPLGPGVNNHLYLVLPDGT